MERADVDESRKFREFRDKEQMYVIASFIRSVVMKLLQSFRKQRAVVVFGGDIPFIYINMIQTVVETGVVDGVCQCRPFFLSHRLPDCKHGGIQGRHGGLCRLLGTDEFSREVDFFLSSNKTDTANGALYAFISDRYKSVMISATVSRSVLLARDEAEKVLVDIVYG